MGRIIKPSGWQGITRIDQRVICIAEFDVTCAFIRVLPKEGTIYRVAGFAECAGGGPGIYLREIDPAYCPCWRMKPPFDIRAFRPVDEVEKKNEHVTKMLKDILDNTKIETRVPEDA